ncbi:MAG: DNA-directed RNA polymerase subunit beta', partial [Actinomycetota bacterium]
KVMALELFKPFVMKRLVDLGQAQNIKSAKRMVERQRSMVWDVLEEVIHEHPVLLNRAPTLHRLGIQAFEPILVEGKAIRIHPLVCTAFNADFDGDQMAVHVPLSSEAQAEARLLMLSTHNLLSPAHGSPIVTPTKDMILGTYYLTLERRGLRGEGRAFGSAGEAGMAYDFNQVALQAPIKVRMTGKNVPELDSTSPDGSKSEKEDGRVPLLETTVGRLIFNSAFPDDFPHQNRLVGRAELGQLVDDCAQKYPKSEVSRTLDSLKSLGFHFSTKAGFTFGLSDVVIPPNKPKILAEHEKRAERVEQQYRRGIITDDERRQELIEIWEKAKHEVQDDMESAFQTQEVNPVYTMSKSGARGNIMQILQIAGMRGLVANPRGEIIPRPIKANFREGLSVLEYFISTHGARKGLADTALRTADSGYLTRRLVDVAQEIIVREQDCGTERGVPVQVSHEHPVTKKRVESGALDTKLFGRVTLQKVVKDRKTVADAGELVDRDKVDRLVAAAVDEVRVRSVLTCESRYGVCAMCYGRNMATG